MLGTLWAGKSIFFNCKFYKFKIHIKYFQCKFRIQNESALSTKYVPDFEHLVQKKMNAKYLIMVYIDYMWKR